MDKIPVAVLGATGAVGQRLVALLENHPYFEVKRLCASERSSGREYGSAVNWILPTPLPGKVAAMTVEDCHAASGYPVVFSAMDASVAGPLEEDWALMGSLVATNTKCHRMRADVPLVVPEVNASHLKLARAQAGPGAIVANPNCSTIGLVMALKPLADAFGLEAVHVTTLQAASGAGYPGVPSLDLLDNAVPYIGGEEDKLETEPAKILGSFSQGSIELARFPVSASCHRVAVSDGHLESVSVSLGRTATAQDILAAWDAFSGEELVQRLPSYAPRPLRYRPEPNRPQPRLDRDAGNGMAVTLGRLRPCPVLGWKFELLSHNTVRGAAGGTILLAEACLEYGLVRL